ncbi:unnamed protein product [Rodentolepis nana]|uniref:Kinesin motor domain-containing protein n=1 Tax=Rodentolepis nana TaxID=102285 RepID=A0A0R3U0P3_RODNA|nr:unnamed protein product [Rodentolepis nana]
MRQVRVRVERREEDSSSSKILYSASRVTVFERKAALTLETSCWKRNSTRQIKSYCLSEDFDRSGP